MITLNNLKIRDGQIISVDEVYNKLCTCSWVNSFANNPNNATKGPEKEVLNTIDYSDFECYLKSKIDYRQLQYIHNTYILLTNVQIKGNRANKYSLTGIIKEYSDKEIKSDIKDSIVLYNEYDWIDSLDREDNYTDDEGDSFELDMGVLETVLEGKKTKEV